MSETKVENVKDFLDKLTEIQRNKHVNTELFFRGHADKVYVAEPTIFRKNGNGERNLLKNEKNLFNDIITQCPEDFKDCQYTFEYLVKMQHYGLPTRLLDITSNALVALYFACCSLNSENNYKDGQVLVYAVLKDAIKSYNSDTVSVLSNLAKLNYDFEMLDIEKIENLKELMRLQNKLIGRIINIFKEDSLSKLSEFVCISQSLQLACIKKKYQTSKQYKELEIIKIIERMILLLKFVSKEKEDIYSRILEDFQSTVLSEYNQLLNFNTQKERFLHFIKQEKSYFIDRLNSEFDLEKIVCVRAKLNNQRIIRQSGLFFCLEWVKQKIIL
ncbi:hypothetical protein CIN_09850 [Commensalibacter intestini A911]|uniref:FRG domain-containing protein n=1 Tax=Commensalibacter intestini A911 TaxID=1088868 RepID=G6F039_9PROT|nr:FRG domain-containing protein [Commensalibacter intestini]EHD14121.1 hypothetical protein CIN_09850 [Commensalibacter intestini A911]